MTVGKLRRLLAHYNDEQEVRFGADYRDYNHTMVYYSIRKIEELMLERSEYFGYDVKTQVSEDDEDDFKGSLTVVIG